MDLIPNSNKNIMGKKTDTNWYDTNSEMSMESIEELAVEQIRREDEKESTLIDQVSQEHFGMNNSRIDEAVEILVNEELRCDICKSIPCAMVVKQTTIETMVANLSKKWDMTRSAGNSKIREYVFGYLENDADVPTVNGVLPDCVLIGVLDLIPDPISSFPDPNIRMKTSSHHDKCDIARPTAAEQNSKYDFAEKNANISNRNHFRKNTDDMIQEINHYNMRNNRIGNTDDTSSIQTNPVLEKSDKRTINQIINMKPTQCENERIQRIKKGRECTSALQTGVVTVKYSNEEGLDDDIKKDQNNKNVKIIETKNCNNSCEREENKEMENQGQNNTHEYLANYDDYQQNLSQWDAAMIRNAGSEQSNYCEENEDEQENEIQILKENVQDIFDQLTNLELLVQSLHEKIDVIADHVL